MTMLIRSQSLILSAGSSVPQSRSAKTPGPEDDPPEGLRRVLRWWLLSAQPQQAHSVVAVRRQCRGAARGRHRAGLGEGFERVFETVGPPAGDPQADPKGGLLRVPGGKPGGPSVSFDSLLVPIQVAQCPAVMVPGMREACPELHP